MESPIQWHPTKPTATPAKKIKLQLIQPPDDVFKQGGLSSAPIGLELIASSLGDNVTVEIFDGGHTRLEEILERLDGDYIGVQDWYTKHDNTLTILRKAKEIGAITLVGGPNATHLSDRLLRNHSFIDYVVIGDGEQAVPQLLGGVPLELIPNLVYRKDNEIQRNANFNVKLNTIFDLTHFVNFPLEKYKIDPFPLSSVRGCIKADLGERCSFCSIEHTLKIMNVDKVWEQIDLLHSKYGLSYFHETGDSFLVGNWPQKLLAARPEHLKHVSFSIYAGIEEIAEKHVEILRDLNIKVVFVGVESTDPVILDNIKKYYTIDEIHEKLDILHRAGIIADVPFIFGLPGESKETLETTYQFVKETLELRPDTRIMTNIIVPIFGCDLFDDLASMPEVRQVYRGNLDRDDVFDYELLIRLLVHHKTSVGYDVIMQYMKKTRLLFGRKGAGESRRYKILAAGLRAGAHERRRLRRGKL